MRGVRVPTQDEVFHFIRRIGLLLALVSLLPIAAWCQYPYGNSPSWKCTVTATGTVSGYAWGSSFSHDVNSSSGGMMSAGAPTLNTSSNTCNATRTVTYHVKAQWTYPNGSPAPNPPRSIIMKTSSSAFWYGPNNQVSGSCNNGIGGVKLPPYSGVGETQAYDKYEAKDGSSGLIEYDVSTSASFSATGPLSGYSYGCGTGVAADVIVCFVGLDGVITDGGVQYAMVGRGVTGTMFTGSFQCSRYTWEITGTTFQSFTVSQDQTSGTLVDGPGPLNQRTFHCYWRRNEGIYITCTADVITPSGTVTVMDMKQVTIEAPNYSFTSTTGPVSLLTDGVRAGSPDANITTPGITFTYWGETPLRYRQGSTMITAAGDVFIGQLTQRYMRQDRTAPYTPYIRATNGMVLDNGWPYNGSVGAAHNTHPAAILHNTDSPEYGFLPGGLGAPYHITVNDSFTAYGMYVPPGYDVQCVPLAYINWGWNADASKNNGAWTLNSGSVTGGGGSTRIYHHPTWTSKYTNVP